MTCTHATHATAVRDDAKWSAMHPIGVQFIDADESLELRNCTCESTLSRPIATPWYPELLEHVAVYAAERGDTTLEILCDGALAGESGEDFVIDAVRNDDALAEWCGRRMRRRAR